MRVYLGIHAVVAILLALGFTAQATEPEPESQLFHREPSNLIAHIKTVENNPGIRGHIAVQRDYLPKDCLPISFDRDTLNDTGRAWGAFGSEIRRIVGELEVLHEPLWRSGSSTIDRTVEFDLREYHYHEKSEKTRQEGDEYTVVRVRVAVSHSPTFEDIDLVYFAMWRMSGRVLGFELGPFPDVDGVVGDSCYHYPRNIFGFVRGNVVVELNFEPEKRVMGSKGYLTTRQLMDKQWREKMVEAARRIDQLLQEKMFSSEVRTRIAAAEEKRGTTESPIPQTQAPKR